MKITRTIESIDDVEFELLKDGKLKPSSDNHNYVNNKELLNEFIRYHEMKSKLYTRFYDQVIANNTNLDSKELNKLLSEFRPPKISNKIGAAIIQIANRRCNSRQYIGYSNAWKEELISNAIMTATIRCHNFDPEKSNNPFAYLTQICDNAIKEQIKKEKKQLYVKYKSIEEANGFYGDMDEHNMNANDLDHQLEGAPSDQRRKYIDEYEHTHFPKKEHKEQIHIGGLEEFFKDGD